MPYNKKNNNNENIYHKGGVLCCGKSESFQFHHETQEAEPIVKGSLFPGIHLAKQTWISQTPVGLQVFQIVLDPNQVTYDGETHESPFSFRYGLLLPCVGQGVVQNRRIFTAS